MMPLSRLGCPLSLKTAHMGNPGLMLSALRTRTSTRRPFIRRALLKDSKAHRLQTLTAFPRPIEYLHHDDHINPRTIGSNLRKLVVEFHRKLPQLHISLGWIDTSDGNQVKVKIFDGQHKAAAQVLLGARTLPVRVFIDPDTDLLLTMPGGSARPSVLMNERSVYSSICE